jgi:hypothetical protein
VEKVLGDAVWIGVECLLLLLFGLSVVWGNGGRQLTLFALVEYERKDESSEDDDAPDDTSYDGTDDGAEDKT